MPCCNEPKVEAYRRASIIQDEIQTVVGCSVARLARGRFPFEVVRIPCAGARSRTAPGAHRARPHASAPPRPTSSRGRRPRARPGHARRPPRPAAPTPARRAGAASATNRIGCLKTASYPLNGNSGTITVYSTLATYVANRGKVTLSAISITLDGPLCFEGVRPTATAAKCAARAL